LEEEMKEREPVSQPVVYLAGPWDRYAGYWKRDLMNESKNYTFYDPEIDSPQDSPDKYFPADLEAIRKIRNKYVHLNIIDDADSAKKNALVVLNNLISVLNSEKPMFTDYSVYLPLIEKFDKEVDVLK